MEDFILSNKERIQIFKILSENKRLGFNEILKKTDMRSNKLSYQLNLMKEKDFLEDLDGNYSLTKEAQRLIPYFSQIFKKEVGVLSVILGLVRNEDKILLIKRRKMPYKGYWSVFGGKQINGESISETIVREVKEEAHLDVDFVKCNAVVYERLREDGYFKHSFLFIITTVEAKSLEAYEMDEGEVSWFDFEDVKSGKVSGVIPSDIEFIKRYSDKEIQIDHVIQDEDDEKLTLC